MRHAWKDALNLKKKKKKNPCTQIAVCKKKCTRGDFTKSVKNSLCDAKEEKRNTAPFYDPHL